MPKNKSADRRWSKRAVILTLILELCLACLQYHPPVKMSITVEITLFWDAEKSAQT
jgi:hypothetical protein